MFLQEYIRENHMKKNDKGGFDNVFFQTNGGQLLKNLVENGLKLSKDNYYIDYAYNLVPQVITRDNSGRAIKYKPPTQAEIREESQYLFEKIVREKPDIIIPTGGIGTKLLIDKTAITQVRGVPEKVTVTAKLEEIDSVDITKEKKAKYEKQRDMAKERIKRAEAELESHNKAYGTKHPKEKEQIRYTIRKSKQEIQEISDIVNGEESHEVWVLPMFSMEYMLHSPSVQNLIESDMITLQKFIEQGEKAFQASDVDYNFVDTIEEARRIFLEEVPKAPVVAWDLETNTLKPEYEGAKILVVTISTVEGEGSTIPLEHKDFTWKPEELEEIYSMLRDMVADPNITKVGHNIQYDIRFLILTQGFTEFANNRDTKIMYYLLIDQEEEGSLKLSDLAYELTDMGGYDKPMDEYRKKYIAEYRKKRQEEIEKLRAEHREKVKEDRAQAEREGRRYVAERKTFPKVESPKNEIDGGDFNFEWFPLKEVLHYYASGDVDAGLRIHNKLDELGKKPENKNLRYLYTTHYPELTKYLAVLEANGVQMDTEYTEGLAERYIEEEERLEEAMREHPIVQKLEDEHRQLYERGLQEWTIPKQERDLEIAKLRDRYKNKLKFNPNAYGDKQRVLFDLTGIRMPYNREYLVDSAVDNNLQEDEIEWFHYKTNKVVLNYIKEHYKEYAELAELLLTHSLVKTRRRGFTYKLRDMVDEKGLLHGQFNSTGTGCVTGDTLILTSEGIQEIENLDDNREKNTFSDIDLEIHSHVEIEKVDGFYYSGKGVGKKIKLVDGTTLTTTNDHPLMKQTYLSQKTTIDTNSSLFQDHLKKVDWVEAENISKGDFLTLKIGTHLYGNKDVLKNGGHNKGPKKMTKELAEWLGMYMAKGSITASGGSYSIKLDHSKQEPLQKFLELTKQLFNTEEVAIKEHSNGYVIEVNSNYVGKWLAEVLDSTTENLIKDVPAEILQGTKEIQESFIKGLTTNSVIGEEKQPSIQLASVSYRMMDKVRVMLLNMGIYASIREGKTNTKEVLVTRKYAEKFLNTIGFIEVDKASILRSKLEKSGNEDNNEADVIESPEYIFVRVKEVEDKYGEFFDLHVPNSHSFVGGGVVNHNTTRLSSRDPNLQQIPRNTQDPKRFDYKNPIKRMFVSRFEGGAIIEGDYSGLESRLLALAAKDEEMTKTFLEDGDIHSETASLVFNKPVESITNELREAAKATTFGISYGETPFSYYGKHDMSLKEAETLFDNFFRNKPKIKQFIDETHEKVKKDGYIETLHGFRRNLRDVYSQDRSKQNEALRQAVNTRIQGTGAFLTNTSVIFIQKWLEKNNMKSVMVLTVHDSIVVDAHPDEINIVAKAVKYIMENLPIKWLNIEWEGRQMRYPLEADIDIGVTYNDVIAFEEEDFNTFKTVKGYCRFYLDLQKIRDYYDAELIDEEKYEELTNKIESSKYIYQNEE